MAVLLFAKRQRFHLSVCCLFPPFLRFAVIIASTFIGAYRIIPQGIGRTERKYLKKDTRITTPVLTISSLPFIFDEGGDFSDDIIPSWWGSLFEDDSLTYWSQLDDDSFTFLESPAANYSTGTLYLELRQASYSHTIIEDVDPLDVANILGNIGGFFGK